MSEAAWPERFAVAVASPRALTIPVEMYTNHTFLNFLPAVIRSFNESRDPDTWRFARRNFVLRVERLSHGFLLCEEEGQEADGQ